MSDLVCARCRRVGLWYISDGEPRCPDCEPCRCVVVNGYQFSSGCPAHGEEADAGTRTARPWPDGARPTPEQLADWLRVCTRDERVAVCDRLLSASERASRCFEGNHDALQAEVDDLRRHLSLSSAQSEGESE